MPCVEYPDNFVSTGVDLSNNPISFPVVDGAPIACVPVAAKSGFLEVLNKTLPKTARTLEAAAAQDKDLGDLRFKYFPLRYKPKPGTCCNSKVLLEKGEQCPRGLQPQPPVSLVKSQGLVRPRLPKSKFI